MKPLIAAICLMAATGLASAETIEQSKFFYADLAGDPIPKFNAPGDYHAETPDAITLTLTGEFWFNDNTIQGVGPVTVQPWISPSGETSSIVLAPVSFAHPMQGPLNWQITGSWTWGIHPSGGTGSETFPFLAGDTVISHGAGVSVLDYPYKDQAFSGTETIDYSWGADPPTPTPEPGALAVLGSALAGLGMVIVRRFRAENVDWPKRLKCRIRVNS